MITVIQSTIPNFPNFIYINQINFNKFATESRNRYNQSINLAPSFYIYKTHGDTHKYSTTLRICFLQICVREGFGEKININEVEII